jgi:hypothetical protein
VSPVEFVDIDHRGPELSVVMLVNGERFPLWYRSSVPLAFDRCDALVPVGLLAAMRARTPLRLPGPVSARLLANLEDVQHIISAFTGRELTAGQRVEADAVVATGPPDRGFGTLFGGGVDAFYTALEHELDLTHLVYLTGFDVLDPQSRRGVTAATTARDVAATMGKELIELETNARAVCFEWGTPILHWGPALASVALLLQDQLRRIAFPASDSYATLIPWGEHPLLDPRWGTEALEIDHDGCEATRVQKVFRVARSDLALHHLRVCNARGEPRNCGRCEKCLRTMVSLRLAGALDRCATLPDTVDLRAVAALEMAYDSASTYTRENIAAAYDARDWPLLLALTWSLRRRPVRQMRHCLGRLRERVVARRRG